MTRNTEIFIEIFNELEEAFKTKLHKMSFTPFAMLVNEASQKDGFVRKHKSMLESIGDLRNVLVHKEGNTIIAVPSDEAVEMLKKFTNKYKAPKLVYDLVDNDVIRIEGSRTLYEALLIMKKYGYTKLPIYHERTYCGLLSGNVVTRYFVNHMTEDGDINQALKTVTVDKVLKEAERGEQVVFVPRDIDVYEFVGLMKEKPSKSGVYIMTHNGRPDEMPLKMITYYDYGVMMGEMDLL